MGGPPTSLEDSRVGKEFPGNENFLLRQLLKQAAAVGAFIFSSFMAVRPKRGVKI
jgi:hypothetical protein